MHPIQVGWTKAMAVSQNLGQYYLKHPGTENEILVKVSCLITAYCLALEDLVRSLHYDDAVLQRVIKVVESVDPDEADLTRAVRQQLRGVIFPDRRDGLRKEHMQRYFEKINGSVDLGRRLLRVRILREKGASEAEIKQAREEPPENVF